MYILLNNRIYIYIYIIKSSMIYDIRIYYQEYKIKTLQTCN